jgi:protein O-GlcNAc transferase
MTTDRVFRKATRLHESGRLAEAERMCRQVLARKPNHTGALRLLGLLSQRTNQADIAEDLIRKAIAVTPPTSAYHVNLADVLASRGRLEEAVSCYRQALALEPGSFVTHIKLGKALRTLGRLDEALDANRKALALSPNYAEAHHNLGEILQDMGKPREAEAAFRQAKACKEDLAEAYNTIGNSLVSMGREEESLEQYTKALRIQPKNAMYHYNTGIPLKALGRWEQCESAYRRALELRPDYPEALNNLGILLMERGRLEESVEVLKQAVAAKPDFTAAFHNLGNSLKDLGRIDEAQDALQRAVALMPDFANACNTLGIVNLMAGRVREAMKMYRQAIDAAPDHAMAHSNLIFAMSFSAGCDAPEIFRQARQWDDLHGKPVRHLIRPHDNDRDPDRRLRVGYVSADFAKHVVGFNLLPLMREHDPGQVEVFCYSGVTRPDEMTDQLRAHSHHWREAALLSDERLAAQIREDRIDLLIDLSLHTGGNRLRTFAMVPAPVQITYLGYCATSGVEGMHYRFSDPHLDPPEQDLSCYSEQTIRLPETYWCYAPGGDAPEPSPPPVERNGHITFGCMNQFQKTSPAAMELWCEILNRTPRSRLLLHAMPGKHLDAVADRLAGRGIASDRLEFVGRQSWEQYMHTYDRIDVGLDPFPYNGGITTCDTMWMGVPVVSLSGQTAVARGGRSILCNVGLADLVARDPEQYVRLAVELADDLPRLSELRHTLRPRMKASPLMDAPRFAANVEAAYRDAWRRWCAKA